MRYSLDIDANNRMIDISKMSAGKVLIGTVPNCVNKEMRTEEILNEVQD